MMLADAGLTEQALAIFRHAGLPDIMGPTFRPKSMLMNQYLVMIGLMRKHGDESEAERHLALMLPFTETVRRHGGRTAGIHLAGARAYALAGRRDEALEQLRLSAEAIDSPAHLAELAADPIFAEVRDDPRFKSQLKLIRDKQTTLIARIPETFRRHGLPAWAAP
jgi:hypothetical protein